MSPPSIASVLAALGRTAPWSKAAGWDPVGLQLGDPAAIAGTVAVCHEVTEEVVAAAGAVGLLISYHPLLFRPTVRLVAGPDPAGRALRLAGSGTALAVVHTAFDVASGGCADSLAGALGLASTRGFGPAWGDESVKFVTYVPAGSVDAVVAAMAAAGAGIIGGYSACSFRTEGIGTFLPGPGTSPVVGTVGSPARAEEVRIEMNAPAGRRDRVAAALVAAHPYEEPAFDVFERRGDAAMVGRVGSLAATATLADVARRAGEVLGGVVRYAGDPERLVRTVACVPGSGGSLLDAVPGDADVVVTGDVSHHRAREATARGLAVIDPGHVATERPGVRSLYAAVSAAVDGAMDLTGIDPDPWRGA